MMFSDLMEQAGCTCQVTTDDSACHLNRFSRVRSFPQRRCGHKSLPPSPTLPFYLLITTYPNITYSFGYQHSFLLHQQHCIHYLSTCFSIPFSLLLFSNMSPLPLMAILHQIIAHVVGRTKKTVVSIPIVLSKISPSLRMSTTCSMRPMAKQNL